MTTPLISIIITAYNYEKFVGQCIESCLGQTGFDAFEVILIDDGSTDSTLSIAQRYAPRLQVVSTRNGGVEKAGNLGIKLARGAFCVRVDADDFLFPDYLSTLAPYLKNSDWAFCYPDYSCVDTNGAIIRHVSLPEFDAEEIRERGDFLAGGTLYRKSLLEKLGGYSEETANCGLENYELILAILQHGGTGQHIPADLFAYRTHDKNMSLTRREHIIAYGSKLAAKFGLPAYRTNKNHPYGLVL
jgi:glycosyltransferase involved in cell wall biosynthesis